MYLSSLKIAAFFELDAQPRCERGSWQAATDFVEPGASAFIQLVRSPKLDRGNLPCGKIIYCTDHAELLLGHHLRQNRGCLLQSLHIIAYIRDNRALLKIRPGLLHFPFNTRFHGPHQIRDMPGQIVAFLKCRYGGIDRATTAVAEHHDQLGAKHCSAELQTRKTLSRYEIARNANNKQISWSLIKSQLGCDPGICAT